MIITFYSYKGGVGRSMALANIAVLLSKMEKKILIIDWDLEAPGLEAYFSNYMRYTNSKGLLNYLIDSKKLISVNYVDYLSNILIENKYKIDIIHSGKSTNDSYISTLGIFNWRDFYSKYRGFEILEKLRINIKNNYDFVLIDSRTGLTDSSGICTIFMPDLIIPLFTANHQSIDGVKEMLEISKRKRKLIFYARMSLLIFPIPSRFGTRSEYDISQYWLDQFEIAFGKYYREWLPNDQNIRLLLEQIKLPHIDYLSFGERLAVLEQSINDPESIGYQYDKITKIIYDLYSRSDIKYPNTQDNYIKITVPGKFDKSILTIILSILTIILLIFLENRKSILSTNFIEETIRLDSVKFSYPNINWAIIDTSSKNTFINIESLKLLIHKDSCHIPTVKEWYRNISFLNTHIINRDLKNELINSYFTSSYWARSDSLYVGVNIILQNNNFIIEINQNSKNRCFCQENMELSIPIILTKNKYLVTERITYRNRVLFNDEERNELCAILGAKWKILDLRDSLVKTIDTLNKVNSCYCYTIPYFDTLFLSDYIKFNVNKVNQTDCKDNIFISGNNIEFNLPGISTCLFEYDFIVNNIDKNKRNLFFSLDFKRITYNNELFFNPSDLFIDKLPNLELNYLNELDTVNIITNNRSNNQIKNTIIIEKYNNLKTHLNFKIKDNNISSINDILKIDSLLIKKVSIDDNRLNNTPF